MSRVRGPNRSAPWAPGLLGVPGLLLLLGPNPAEFRLDALGGRQQVERGQAGRHDEHRVQVVRLRRTADRRGLVDGRDGQHVSIAKAADGLHASLKGTQPVAQVAAHGQHHAVAHGQDRPVTARTTGSGGPAAPAAAALCQAAATRTASAFSGTWCTRTHQAPAAAASAVIATVAPSQSANGLGVPSGPASRLPRKRFLDAPTRTGKVPPASVPTSARWVSSGQLCSGRLPNPRPGSTTMRPGSTPACTTASTRRASSSRTSPTTSA